MDNKESILIIGSKDHPQATKSIDWGESAYVGDFDVLIVDTTTLNKQRLGEIFSVDQSYFDNLRRNIIDTQTKKGIDIICITSPLIVPTVINKDYDDEDNYSELKRRSNYSWCPVIPILERVPVSQILDRENSSLNLNYLAKIANYSLILDRPLNNTGYYDHNRSSGVYTELHISKVLENNIGRSVAFEVLWRVYQHSEYNLIIDSKKSILFIPPAENVKEGINILVGDYLSTPEEEAPDWIEAIDIPGTSDITKNIEAQLASIKTTEDKIKEMKVSLAELTKYKKLLYATGDELEDIVEQSFELLGIKLTKPEISNVEDRFYSTEDNHKIFIEVRGVNRLMGEVDLTQLIKRIAEKPYSALFKTRGVFVFNHQNKTEPNKRDQAFHHNIVKQAKSYNLCLIDSPTLFRLVVKRLGGEAADNIANLVFNTHGALTIEAEMANNLPKTKEQV